MNDGRKRKPQKHQNKVGFKIQFDQLAIDMQKKVSLHLLCKRCVEQMTWKLQFNKYKKITEPGRCHFCNDKCVARSYMRACDKCAQKEDACPKCLNKDAEMLNPNDARLTPQEQTKKDKEEEKALNSYIDSLKERSRRKMKREYEKGIVTWDNENGYFIDAEGNEIVGLKFKSKNIDDLEQEMEDDESFNSEDENESSKEKETKNKNEEVNDNEEENKEDEGHGSDNDEDFEDEDEDEQQEEELQKDIKGKANKK